MSIYRYVYERLAGASRRAGFKELLLTQLVNALWHGIAPRYLAFFVHSVFFIQFSSVISRIEGLMPQAWVKSYLWRGVKVRGLQSHLPVLQLSSSPIIGIMSGPLRPLV
jgi:D-alanyl-lipoteichoic acid acyltransferase DltB (MBOAT superfamily)